MEVEAKQRKAGVLLHPTSLPGVNANGELGNDAFRFVDFLVDCGIKVWQVLPIGPTHDDNSPYQCLSAHAGNVDLISIEKILDAHWLDNDEYHTFFQAAFENTIVDRSVCLDFIYLQFCKNANDDDKRALNDFQEKQKSWLHDFALFVMLRKKYVDQSWATWPSLFRDRNLAELDKLRDSDLDGYDRVVFEQYLFFQQWLQLKQYANSKGVELFGDLPLFVAHDSADVWAKRELFKLDGDGSSTVVAGVPPDYFSETGQRWGNPIYDWVSMEVDGYQWWIERFETLFELFDLVRIDHFRGLESYWEIPSDHETAMHGSWVPGPGEKLFHALQNKFGEQLPLVAEDLGIITQEVDALREKFKLPGMKILHFAFDSGPKNPYLPHNHEPLSVVYTGTHDNDTTLGWYDSLDDGLKRHIRHYLCHSDEEMPWLLMRTAFASVAGNAIVPMQDLLSLGSEHRMNTPGTTKGNWQWRFQWQQMDWQHIAHRMRELCSLYNR